MHTYTCMHSFMHHMHACMHAYLCIHHTIACSHISHVCIYMAYMCAFIHRMYVYICMHSCITCMHIYMHAYAHTSHALHIHAFIHTPHAYIYTCMIHTPHAYICIGTYTCMHDSYIIFSYCYHVSVLEWTRFKSSLSFLLVSCLQGGRKKNQLNDKFRYFCDIPSTHNDTLSFDILILEIISPGFHIL